MTKTDKLIVAKKRPKMILEPILTLLQILD